jgi:hypothetical protein
MGEAPRTLDHDVETYITSIPPAQRPLFDRIHRLILEACPRATVGFAYKMPSYAIGSRRLNVGVWKHGVSIYGWKATGDGGLTSRHPEVRTSTGTIRIATDRSDEIGDDEIGDLARAVLIS